MGTICVHSTSRFLHWSIGECRMQISEMEIILFPRYDLFSHGPNLTKQEKKIPRPCGCDHHKLSLWRCGERNKTLGPHFSVDKYKENKVRSVKKIHFDSTRTLCNSIRRVKREKNCLFTKEKITVIPGR